MTRNELIQLHADLCREAMDIMKQKNHDYTSDSKDPFLNFRSATYLGIHPEQGLLLRVMDKVQRLNCFAVHGQLAVQGESAKDAALDIINYMVLLYGLILEVVEEGTDSGHSNT